MIILNYIRAFWNWVKWVLAPEELLPGGRDFSHDAKQPSFFNNLFSAEQLGHGSEIRPKNRHTFFKDLFSSKQLEKPRLSASSACKKTGFIRYLFSSEDLDRDKDSVDE